MSNPPSTLSMPMICPLVKLGRSSPPTADQGYHTALESSHACSQRRTNHNPEQNYHPGHYTKQQQQQQQQQQQDNNKHLLSNCANEQHNFAAEEPAAYNPSRMYGMKHESTRSTQDQQYCPICDRDRDQSSNHSSSSLDYDHRCSHYQNTTIFELSSLSIDDETYWDQIQHNKSYEQSHNNAQQYFDYAQTKPTYYHLDASSRQQSPHLDQGYHTLVSPSGPIYAVNAPQLLKGKKVVGQSKNNSFDLLPDDLVVKCFAWLHSYDLSVVARVCRRFEVLAWRPALWQTITLYGAHLSGDKAIRGVLRQLCGQGRTGACPGVEKVHFSDGVKLTDRGVILLARRCPELTNLQAHGCTEITNSALSELVTRCKNLQHLDITGCTNVSCISVLPGPEPPRRLFLQYLDLTDCSGIDDNGLRTIVLHYPQMVYLYLRRCVQITDAGLKHVPSFCLGLRELSVSDCSLVTDFGLYELAKLGATLRYLSVAKCDQVSDAGLKVIARRCYKLRYLNARGCEAVSDDAITVLARSCTRLRALDIGKCDVSDAGLRSLAESCPNIKKLSLRNCDLVTDRGVQCVAYYCRGLQQLNIQDCQISLEGYRAVKKYCKRCIIEHTNPGFF